MTKDVHERAVRMLSAEQVEGLTADERKWLDAHLSACPGCSEKEEALHHAVSSLRLLSVDLNPALVAVTRTRVRSRAAAIEDQRSRMRVTLAVITLSLVWVAFIGPVTWHGFEWVGRSLGWADGIWQSTFFLAWFLPATAVALILAVLQSDKLNRLKN